MQTRDAIKIGIDSAAMVVNAYLGDMGDADLMTRPHPQCNHINWQVGHLIASEHAMLDKYVPGGMPALPEGFAEKYTRETVHSDDASRFATKQELMATFKTQRDATLKALAHINDADWEKETGVGYAPNVAAIFTMQGSHWLMHCGQWAVVRRQLGKPVVI